MKYLVQQREQERSIYIYRFKCNYCLSIIKYIIAIKYIYRSIEIFHSVSNPKVPPPILYLPI